MNIEILYKDLYVYGEKANATYLEMMFEKHNIIHTAFNEIPYFVDNRPDLIFIDAISEHFLDQIADKLLVYKERLKELIEDGVHIIIMNNAMDIFGKRLNISGFGEAYEGKCLGLLNYSTYRDYDNRHVRLTLAEFNGHEHVAINMGFSQYYYEDESDHLYETTAGYGFNLKTTLGGFRYKNVYCTELVGELFIVNPHLSKALLKVLGQEEKLPYEEYAYEIYNFKLKNLKNDSRVNEPIEE